jgi:hypothetical protein
MVNSGKIVAGGSCNVVAPADSLCPPPTLNVNLNPTTIPDKGTYSLKYDSLNTKNCSVTFPTGETIATYPVAYDFGNVSGERGPVTRDWTVSCLGTNGAIVKKTVTLKIQGPCETVSCPVPKDPCEVNPSSCAPTHKYVCSDGVDNDNDGKVDAADPGCSPYGVYLPKYNTEINKNILCLDVSGNPIVCPVPVDPVCVSGDSRPSCPQEPSTVTDGSSQAKIISFTANPKLILYDKSSKISWKVEGLTGSKKCNITYYTDSSESQADFGTVAASNAESNKVTDLLRKKTTYVLTCGNEIRETTVSVYSLYES